MSEKMELAEAGLRYADGLTVQLDKPDWKPSRAHIEQARNSIKKIAEMILASSPAQEPVTTEPVACLVDQISDEDMRELLSSKDVGSGRGRLKRLLAIPAPPHPGRDNDKHYLAAIRHHLKRLYSIYPNNARLREKISDEIDWIDAALTGEPK